MKINSIYISAFGKLKDYTLTANDGFSVIYGENENGKSTVMAFIKMMFYGSGRKAQQISSNPRLKYLPWSGEPMGGRITFEYAGRRYCLEREFKKSDSTDRIRLTDLDLGTDVPTDGNVGLQFFGLGADAFERSMFVGATGAPPANEKADGELGSRLSNIVLTGDEDTSYQTVMTRLENARFALVSKSGRTGSLVKDAEQAEALKEQLKSAEAAEQSRAEMSDRAERLKAKLKAADGEQKQLRALLQKEKDIKSAEKLKEYLDKKEELDATNRTLTLSDGTVMDSVFVKKLDFCLTKYENEQSALENLNRSLKIHEESIALAQSKSSDETEKIIDSKKAEVRTLEAQKADIQKRIEAAEHDIRELKGLCGDGDKRPAVFNLPLLIIGLIITVGGIVLGLTAAPVLGGIAAVGAIVTALSFILGISARKKADNIKNQLENSIASRDALLSEQGQTEKRIVQCGNDINLLTMAIELDAKSNESRQRELEHIESGIKEAQKRCDAALSDLKALTDKIDRATTEGLRDIMPELERKAQEQKEIKLRLGYLSSDLGGISYDEARIKLQSVDTETLANTDFEAARSRSETLSEEIARLSSELTAVLTELKTGFASSPDPQAVQKKLEELSSRMEAQKLFYDAAGVALEELHESFAEVRRGYGSALENKTLEIFSRLTGGRYGSVRISKAMEMTVEQTGVFGTRELDYLSSGTADQAYLSLRLALSQLISEEPLPVMLDDVLCQYDDGRTALATAFLKEYSCDRQTLLFTCHKSVCEAARDCGAEIIGL